MKRKKIGGRPMLGDADVRAHQVNLRLRLEEYYDLVHAAKKTSLTVSEYARQAITKGKIESRITPEMMDLIRRLCGMDNNLNQIARQANSAGYMLVHRECLRLTDQIGEVIKELRK